MSLWDNPTMKSLGWTTFFQVLIYVIASFPAYGELDVRLESLVRDFDFIESTIESNSLVPESCSLELDDNSNFSDIDYDKAPYAILTSKRSELRSSGRCKANKNKLEFSILKKIPSEYKNLSLQNRARKIYKQSKEILHTMKLVGQEAGKSRYKNYVNGKYIDPALSPELATCIAMYETRGNLNPFAVNYTLCNKSMVSSAHGLGQITRTTIKNMMDNPDGKLIPFNTDISAKYDGMSAKELHLEMSRDPKMQIEMLFRLLNANIKYHRWRSPTLSDSSLIKKAIIEYDRDNQSSYVQKVFNTCLPCLNRSEDTYSCYQKLL